VFQRLDRLTSDEARITAVQALEVVYGLVQNMKEVIARNEHGLTPLHLALQVEAADILLERGASVLAQNDSRWTPLHMASRRGHVEVARVFLEHGSDVEARGRRRIGSTAFGFAEGTCRTSGHVQFLERGADVMVQDKEGSTPLHLASRRGHAELPGMFNFLSAARM
jgi:ankyrin repeat protein